MAAGLESLPTWALDTMSACLRDIESPFADEVEELYSSDIIYTAVTEGNTDIIDRVIARYRAGEKITKGKTLLEYMRVAKKRKGS